MRSLPEPDRICQGSVIGHAPFWRKCRRGDTRLVSNSTPLSTVDGWHVIPDILGEENLNDVAALCLLKLAFVSSESRMASVACEADGRMSADLRLKMSANVRSRLTPQS